MDTESNQIKLNDEFKDRQLLAKLKQLIFNLVDIEEDMARLDVSNVGACVANVKRVLLLHEKDVINLKKEVDNIRKDILKERGTKSIH